MGIQKALSASVRGWWTFCRCWYQFNRHDSCIILRQKKPPSSHRLTLRPFRWKISTAFIYQTRFLSQTPIIKVLNLTNLQQKPHDSKPLQTCQGGFGFWWKRNRSHWAMDLFESWVDAHDEICQWIFAADQSRGYEAILRVWGLGSWSGRWVGGVYVMNESRDGSKFYYSWNWLLSPISYTLYLTKNILMGQKFPLKKACHTCSMSKMFCQACSP